MSMCPIRFDLNHYKMSLENIALGTLGAKVVNHSSSSDEHDYPPSNVLTASSDEIWNSAEGLPQFITISLEDVQLQYSLIGRVGFYCWHDYTTNPKTIELEVALSEEDKHVIWERFTLKQMSGKQFFDIQPLPATYRIMKFTITETFGDYETYINQIFIEAQLEDSHLNSMMALKDLEPPLGRSQNRLNNYKEHKHQEEYRHKHQEEYRGKQKYGSKEQISKDEYQGFVENTFHNKQSYADSKHSYSKHSSKYSEEEEEHADDNSLQNDVALLTLSKNVMEMEENVEELKRSLQVLSMRIDVTYEKLEERMVARVDEAVEKKLQKIKQEIINQIRRSQLRQSKSMHENQLRQSKSQYNDRQEPARLKELRSAYEREDSDEQFGRQSQRRGRDRKGDRQSLHLHNLKSNRADKESSKDTVVADLMTKLAKKLEERELKVKKIESKRQKEVATASNRPRPHRQAYP